MTERESQMNAQPARGGELVGVGAGGLPPALPPQAWGELPPPPRRTPFERPLAAIRRYKWLMAGVVVLALVAGGVATRFVDPKYESHATIWIASETPMQERNGPIQSRELLNAKAWVELIRSYRITDAVVRKLSLFVEPEHEADKPLLAGMSLAERFVPGDYELRVAGDGRRWTLLMPRVGAREDGAVGDSIGRRFGIRWMPSRQALARHADRSVEFAIATPRETSIELVERLTPQLPDESNFLWLKLEGTDPELTARTLNTWAEEYVAVAATLKKHHLVEFARILEGQLEFAESSLRGSEAALENFRIATITLPTENSPVAAGVEATRDPALKAFFERKIEYDNLRSDREALEKVLRESARGAMPYESALLIPSVAQNPAAEQLRASFKTLYERQAELSAARQVYTDEYPAVRQLASAVNTLRTETIPQQASALLGQLRERESDYDQRIASASTDLRQIPIRTIEEMRLRRAVMVAEELYTTLKTRHAEARLAEASATPDVNILDSAVAPLEPSRNTTPGIMLMALAGGLAAAVGIALLLDKVDPKLRYPDQASEELGLPIAATVPVLQVGGREQSPEQVSQLVESFRTLRMNVVNVAGAPLALAVSSPSPGDGKSFISSNLAMSFAEGGFRTLLVDGDTRRGTLHDAFGLRRTPGLTDYLAGEASRSEIVKATDHRNLSVIASGNARQRSPELLASPAMGTLVASLRAEYDVIIFDTPPLAAGIDGYAIAAAAGNLLVVLRVGATERRMAAAKLLLVDRLPISVVGAVLNATPSEGEYEYYSYLRGYEPVDLEEGKQVPQLT